MKLRPAALAALTFVLAVPVVATAAPAPLPSRATTTDVAGDVRVIGPNGVGAKAPTRRMGDVRTVQITHTRTAVKLRMTYVALGRVGTDHLHVFAIRTPRRSYEVQVYATAGSWKGTPVLFARNGATPRCAISRNIDYPRRTITVSVPRKCLGTPRWIQAGGGMSASYNGARYADDGLTAKPPASTLVLGPKLYA